jgi:cytochrome c oxidase accessory protein FixG
MLIDIVNRKFSLLGNIIWAQDTYLLAIIMSVIVVFVVLFTVTFGRLWCGWACPQPVFLEMVFRRIEYLFEGNYRNGIRNEVLTTAIKIKKVVKHIVYFVVSVIITHIFIMWFIGPERLWQIIQSPISSYKLGFSFMLAVSGFYYWIYAFFREQVCTMACPYGRMQGVLLDSKSITVIYDYKLGEPRGAKAAGQCINCNQCVTVCPTGIDIKNGSQLECINCTACIDECNSVMRKLKRAENLIRFDSVHGVETGQHTIGSVRTWAYSVVLAILLIVLIAAVSKRTATDSSVLRVPGTMFQEVDSNTFSNIFNLKVINKTQTAMRLQFKLLKNNAGLVQLADSNNLLTQNGKLENILIVKLNKSNINHRSTSIEIGIYDDNKLLEKVATNFIGPAK